MASLQTALMAMRGRDVTVWLDHPELKALAGRLTDAKDEHIELDYNGSIYCITYSSIVAIRRT